MRYDGSWQVYIAPKEQKTKKRASEPSLKPRDEAVQLRLADDVHGAHHLVVLVFQDVAMPDKLVSLPAHYLGSSWQIKLHRQLGYRTGERLHHVLEGVLFFGNGCLWRRCEYELTSIAKRVLVKRLPADDLELHQVNVLGMRTASVVDHVPDFG